MPDQLSRPDEEYGAEADTATGPVPSAVIDLLLRVRETGRTNMMVSTGVLRVASELADDPDDYAAWLWLVDHRKRHVEALQAMAGQRRQEHQ